MRLQRENWRVCTKPRTYQMHTPIRFLFRDHYTPRSYSAPLSRLQSRGRGASFNPNECVLPYWLCLFDVT